MTCLSALSYWYDAACPRVLAMVGRPEVKPGTGSGCAGPVYRRHHGWLALSRGPLRVVVGASAVGAGSRDRRSELAPRRPGSDQRMPGVPHDERSRRHQLRRGMFVGRR
jgi:hypothetical protein